LHHGTPEDSHVVCSIRETDRASTERRLLQVPPGCSLVEIRGDHLAAGEIAALLSCTQRPVIVTIRRADDDGGFEGTESERRRLLLGALEAGAGFVDVELTSELRDLADGEQASRVILSDHGAPCDASVLATIYGRMAKTRAGRLKIVPDAGAPRDTAAVRSTLAIAVRDGRPLACFAGGRAGAVSRLMAPAWGSWATYGAVERGAETAEGQFTATDLLELYDVARSGPDTRRFAIAGNAVFGSPSPAIHAAGYRAAGLDARYLPVEADRLEECEGLFGRAGLLGLEGLAVTIPFKEAARARCGRLDEVAEASGAVNTVLFEGGGWAGYNTDGPAILSLVRAHVDPAGARVAIVGAGGTARAAAAVLSARGARVTLYNRTSSRARHVAETLGVEAAPFEELDEAVWDVLVQATPLGAQGERVLPAERLAGHLVLDAVYGVETPLVRDARQRGVAVVDGFELLVEQALLQFERMTGRRPDASSMRVAGRAWLTQRQGGCSG